MDTPFNQDQVNSNIDSAVINHDNHNTIDKQWSMRNFIFCPFSIDLWDIQDLTLQIDDDIEDDKLRYSSQTLSKLSQLNKLTILISKEYPESVVNTLLVGISNLINLSDLSIKFQLKQDLDDYYNFKDVHCGQSHFFKSISKLIGLKKLSLQLSQQNDATLNKLFDSVILLPNLVYLQIDLGALYLKNRITYIKLNYLFKLIHLFKLKQFQQFNLVMPDQLESEKSFTTDISQLPLLTHLSLICDQYALTSLDLNTFTSLLSTLKNVEYLELEIRTSEDLVGQYGMGNPFIRAGSFANLIKLESLKITFVSQLNSNVQMQKWIYEAISQLTNLSQLTLNINHPFRLENKGSTILGQSLSNLLKLTELQINEIPFNENLLESISKLTQLLTLNLSFSASHECLENDYQYLSICIAKLVNLEKLNLTLQDQQITEFQITIITSAIFNLAALSSLKLQLNRLRFQKSMVLFASEKCKVSSNLKELDLSLADCKVNKNKAQYLPIGISMLTNLISLKISGYKIDHNLFKQILSEATQLPQLCILISTGMICMNILRLQRERFLKKCLNLVTLLIQND